MKEFKHLGAYGLIIKDGKILLIKKIFLNLCPIFWTAGRLKYLTN